MTLDVRPLAGLADIDGLASLCDRVVVLRHGRVSATLSGDVLTTHAVLEAMNADALEDT